MSSSLCILGRQPALGLAELESLYGAASVQPAGAQAALINLAPASIDFDRIGGSIKLCEVLTTYATIDFDKVQKQLNKDRTLFSFLPTDSKVTLGISAFGFPISKDKLFATGLTLKKILRSSERAVRLVPLSEGTALSSAQVIHNGLTSSSGCELVLVKSGSETILARTVAEQDIEAYTRRDRERPKRDSRVGMLPPKLAQIIINLAVDTKQATGQAQTLLDPFCGTGVVLQEALLMGYAVYGSDLEPRMTEYSQQNLDWLAQNFTLKSTVHPLETADATSHTWKPVPDFVACESYLGKPFTDKPDAKILATTIAECNLIIKKSLRNIAIQLKPGTRVCIAVPAWQTAPKTFRHLPLLDSPEALGYNRIRFEHVRDTDLVYARADQIVARELLVLTRK